MKHALAAAVLWAPLVFAAPVSAETVSAVAEETLGVACQPSGAMGVGKIRFTLDPAAKEPGTVEYDGLFDDFERYAQTARRVRLTKLEKSGSGAYLFEGVDDTIGGGAVRGHFKNAGDFEVNAYYAKQHRPMECVFYRLAPLKSRWAKKIVKKNDARFGGNEE